MDKLRYTFFANLYEYMEHLESIILSVVRGMVTKPEEVRLKTIHETDERGEVSVVYVRVHEEDVGGCIGEQGETARALRKVIGIVGFNTTGKRVFLKVATPKQRELYYSI